MEIPLRTYIVKEKEVTKLELKNGKPAHLELQVVKGGPVFLFRGSMTAADIEALLASTNHHAHYLLAAAIGQAAYCVLEENPGPLTIWSAAESIGHLRAVEC